MKNAEISAIFTDIAHRLELKKDNIFKVRAYRKVAHSIEQLPVEVEQLVRENRLKEIPGAGEAIIKKITELITTGRLEYYEKLKAESPHQSVPAEATSSDSAGAIKHLKQAISSGKHWYIALLEAIGLWPDGTEDYNGRHYQYLIDGEAFDWLLLAERLCESVDELIPEEEKLALLFNARPPLGLSNSKFKALIGSTKYRQYLNYFYGVTVEEALVLAVQEEIRKEKRTLGYNKEHNLTDEVYQRIYGATRPVLLKRFRREKEYPRLRSISLTELKEFSYWLFKYRLKNCDKARIASDTKKALGRLNANGSHRGLAAAELEV